MSKSPEAPRQISFLPNRIRQLMSPNFGKNGLPRTDPLNDIGQSTAEKMASIKEKIPGLSPEGTTTLGTFSESILDFPDLKAVGVLLDTEPSFMPHITYVLFTPISPDAPETAEHWSSLALARARFRRDSGNTHFVALSAIDTNGKDVSRLLEETSKKWEKEKNRTVLMTTVI